MQDILNKILNNKEISKKSEELKKQGKKVVMVNGVFDLLHVGHVGFLRKAKDKGDVLLVAVNSDKSVKTFKGDDKPIILEKDRAFLIAALSFVDYVTIFNESKALKIIEKIKPDILVKGIRPDIKRLEEEKELVGKHGWKIDQIIHNTTISTGQIIDKIKNITHK